MFMENIVEWMQSNISIIVIYVILFISIVVNFINNRKINRQKKEYQNFLKNIGNGQNIQETLEKHMQKVKQVEELNKEIIAYCEKIDVKHDKSLQKVGMIRYNAFQDVGSNLSFAVALLDNENTGIVLNGIYARDMSNIYAKPVVKGKSTYVLTQEEQDAINKAINS